MAPDARLAGRTRERAHLRAIAHGTAAQGAVLLTGRPGMGRTALLDDLVGDLRDEDVVVLRSGGSPGRRPSPGETVRDLVRRLPIAVGAAVHGADDLRALLTPRLRPEPSTSLRFRDLLGRGARDRRVLVVVDDLQWVDPASRDVLLLAAQHPEPNVGFVLTARAEPPVAPVGAALEQIELRPLHDGLAAQVVAATEPELTPVAVASVVARSGGIPRVLRELATAALRGIVTNPTVPLPATAILDVTHGDVLRELGHAGRLAAVVAAASPDGDVATVRAALEQAGCGRSIDELASSGALEMRHGRIAFLPDALRSIAYHTATEEERRGAHRIHADVCDTAWRTWHRAAAAEHDASLSDELAAVAQAADRPLVAAAAWAESARLTTDPRVRNRRLASAAELALRGGGHRAAVAFAREVTEDADPSAVSRAADVLGHAHLRRGDLRGAIASWRSGAELAGTADPAAAGALLMQAAAQAIRTGATDDALVSARRALALLPAADPRRATAEAVLGAASVLSGDTAPGIALLTSGVRGRWSHASSGGLEILNVVAMALIWAEEYELARDAVDAVVSAAERLHLTECVPGALVIGAIIDYGLGDWDGALHALDQAGRGMDATGVRTWRDIADGMRALIEGCRGTLFTGAGGSGDAFAELPDTPLVRAARAEAALAREEPSGAVDALEPLRQDRSMPNPAPLLWQGSLIEAYVRLGRRLEARELVDDLARRVDRAGHDRGGAMVARSRAMLADDPEAEELFIRAELLADEPPIPWAHARTHFTWGEQHLDRGRPDAAAPHLRTAVAIFEQLGAVSYLHRARALLDRATGRTRHEPASPSVSILLLGRLEITLDGVTTTLPRGQVTRLLEVLATSDGSLHAEQVADRLWADVTAEQSRARLRDLLKRTKSLVGDVVVRDGDLVVLAPGVETDVARFRDAGQDALRREPHDPAGAADVARRALDESIGEFAVDSLYEPWAAPTRESLRQLRLALHDLLFRDALRRDNPGEAEAFVLAALEIEPLDEDRCLESAAAFLAHGARTRAARLLERADAITDELGIGPSPGMLELRRAVHRR